MFARLFRRVFGWEIVTIVLLLTLASLARLFAAVLTGIEVDEPVYRFAAMQAGQYGFPSLRPAYKQEAIPFLYHPPFFLWLLGQWFAFWQSSSFLVGRLFSVCCSVFMLIIFYLFVRQMLGKWAALLALLAVG